MQNNKLTTRLSSLLLSGSLFAAACTFTACSKEEVAPSSPSIASSETSTDARVANGIPGKYIVVLKDASVATAESDDYNEKVRKVKNKADNVLRGKGIRPDKIERTYGNVLKGFAAQLTAQEAAALALDPEVAYVEADQVMSISQTSTTTTTTQPAQTIPYGINRVGAADATGRTAWVIDTGIELNHPDLTVDAARSRSFVPNVSSPTDGNGHGTHVAGTIGAKYNSIGVVGVAANATLVAVRVLDANGSGTSSGVIAGVDYVGAYARVGEVANMSLGGGISQALDDAVVRAANKGILFAVAAGNDAISATQHSPARVNHANVFTVSAMDNTDTFASFSCFGNPPVDFCMPGVNINSTYIGGRYATMSGTSMATPHMAGVLLVRGKHFNLSGTVKGDRDSTPDRIAHI
ncbi:hypothetical protein GCM10023185_09570 [Hymenobacter saemangeumensis]|uniref:S8 family peptidase n=1 Tax=Hymenobacter saemangeumensis TaxID=1084522 RepID=A0ABP8I4H5_9BACT